MLVTVVFRFTSCKQTLDEREEHLVHVANWVNSSSQEHTQCHVNSLAVCGLLSHCLTWVAIDWLWHVWLKWTHLCVPPSSPRSICLLWLLQTVESCDMSQNVTAVQWVRWLLPTGTGTTTRDGRLLGDKYVRNPPMYVSYYVPVFEHKLSHLESMCLCNYL